MRMVGGFCTNVCMPTTVASCGRSFSMIWLASSFRSLRGLRWTTIWPRLGPPSVFDALPPIVETSASTFGSLRMMFATSPWYSTSLS